MLTGRRELSSTVQQNSVPTPFPAETMSSMWFNFHSDERFGINSDELHYWRMLALGLDDDLASLLLLKKLKLADFYGKVPNDVVALNSFLEFQVDGDGGNFCQLVRPSNRQPSFAIRSDTRLGLGLLGLRSGQAILWPDERDSMRTVEILRVENCPGMSDWLADRSEQA